MRHLYDMLRATAFLFHQPLYHIGSIIFQIPCCDSEALCYNKK